MKILVLNPFGATEPFARENLQKVARPDVEIDVVNISDVFPLNYNTYLYNMIKCANAAVERIIKAENEGYDAVVLSCNGEPGLHEARAVVDIPVVGSLEASIHLACMMGKKFSIIAPDDGICRDEDELARRHGVGTKLASLRWIGLTADKLYPEITPTRELEKRVAEVSKKCIEEDGAEVIIPGCTILGAILTKLSKSLTEETPVPIIDPMIAALKMAEMMVDLQKIAGYPPVSRIGLYKKQPAEEYLMLRRWLAEHKSPEQAYYTE